MIAAALAAVGVTPPLDFAARQKAVQDKQTAIENKRAADEREINERRSHVNSKAERDSLAVAAEAEAFELELSKEIAAYFRKYFVPHFESWIKQPNRKDAVKLKGTIYASDKRVQTQLGARLDHVLVLAACTEVLLHCGTADMITAFADTSSFYGPAISAAQRLLDTASSDWVTDFEKALGEIENSLEYIAKTAPRAPVSEDHEHAFDLLCTHAIARHRAQATQAFSLKTADARAAEQASRYRRPSIVRNDGSSSVVSYEATAVVDSEDEGESVITRGNSSKRDLAWTPDEDPNFASDDRI